MSAGSAAAATAINSFLHECSDIQRQACSLADAAIVAATAESVSNFWVKSQSSAAALAAEAAAQLPAQGPDKNHPGDQEHLQRPGIVNQSLPRTTHHTLHGMTSLISYARVSTAEQNPAHHSDVT